MKLSYDRDGDTALENCRFWAPLSLTPEQKHSVEDPIEMERMADELPIKQVAKRWIVSSDPDEVVSLVKPYVDAGFRQLVFHAPGHDQERFLAFFESDLGIACARWPDQSSARSRLIAALMSAKWVKACGKLPTWSPVALTCSA